MTASIPEFGAAEPGADYVLRPGGYLVVGNRQGEVAVLATPRGFFLPGGGQEEGEPPEQAAVREAVEECGLRVRITGQLGLADELVRAADEGRHYRKRCAFFRAEFIRCNEGGESDHQLLWLPADEAATRLSHKSQAWAVMKTIAPARVY